MNKITAVLLGTTLQTAQAGKCPFGFDSKKPVDLAQVEAYPSPGSTPSYNNSGFTMGVSSYSSPSTNGSYAGYSNVNMDGFYGSNPKYSIAQLNEIYNQYTFYNQS
jgi:hypothetical protein